MAPRGIVIQITGDAAGLAAALEQVDAHLRETASQGKAAASEISTAMESIKSVLSSVGVGFSVGAIIGGVEEATSKLKEMVVSSLDFGEAIEKAHLKTGLAAETLSTLHYAAAVTGTDFDTLTAAVAKMDKAIGLATEGDKKSLAFMKALGLNAKQLATENDGAEIAFRKFAATLSGTGNQIQRVTLATQLMGRGGAELIPVLMEVGNNFEFYKQKAMESGEYLDGPGAEALADFNKRLEDLKMHVAGLGLSFTEGLIPALTQLWDVIGAGESPLKAFNELGALVGRGIAAETAGIYQLVAAHDALQAVIATGVAGPGNKVATERWAAAKEAYDKGLKAGDIAYGPDQPSSSFAPAPPKVPRGGFEGVGDLSKTPKAKSTDNIAQAAAALAEANSTAAAAAAKSADDLALAQLEADHKRFLVSDADYYDEKQALDQHSIDAEIAAARQRVTELEALQAKQHGDKTLKRDKAGNSAEELKTARDLVQLNQQINSLEEKRSAIDVNANLSMEERADAVHLESLKAAAQMEEHVNSGITARLALMQREHELAMQKATAEGGDTKTLAALQEQEADLLKIADIERQINQIKQEGNEAVEAQRQRAQKDPSERKAATKEINELNKETAATLQALTAQYDALAQTLGGEFIDKARALHAELANMNTPNQKDSEAPWKTLGDGMESMAEKMAQATGKGRESFHNMAMSMEQDLVELAVKFAAQKWLAPFMNSLGAGIGSGSSNNVLAGLNNVSNSILPGFASGGDPTGPSIVGEEGPELWMPKGPGTIMPNDLLQNLSRGSAGGGAPNVTMNITNASSQPVTARQTGTSFDSDSRQFITHVILEDMVQGGPIKTAMSGFTGS